MFFAGFVLRQTHLSIFGIGETADRTYLVPQLHRHTLHRVGCGDEPVLYRLWNQHQTPGDVAGREDVGRGSPKIIIHPHVTARIRFDTGFREVKAGSIGYPADRDYRQRSFGAVTLTIFGENHSHAIGGLLETLDGAEILSHHYTRDAKGGGDGGRNVFILGM